MKKIVIIAIATRCTVVQQRSSFMLAWWPVHLVAIVIITVFFMWRLKVNSAYHPLVMWARCKRNLFGKQAAA